MQRNNSADRSRVADYSGDDSPVRHMGVSNMIVGFILLMLVGPVEWVATALLLYFSLKQ
jgi:hypothetical protein